MDTQTQERLEGLLYGFEYSTLLPFLACCPNNVGDPFHDSNFLSNTHDMEREVREATRDGIIRPRGVEIFIAAILLRKHGMSASWTM